MSRKCTALDFAEVINEELQAFKQEKTEQTKQVITEVTKETVSKLKNIAPKGYRGKYAKSFYAKKEFENNGSIRYRIANKEYQLTHLLENGHALRQGGRTRAFPHWKTAEDELNNELPRKLKEVLGR